MIAINNRKEKGVCLDQHLFVVCNATLRPALGIMESSSLRTSKPSNPMRLPTVIMHFRNYRADLLRRLKRSRLDSFMGRQVTRTCDKCTLIRIHCTTERHNKLDDSHSGPVQQHSAYKNSSR